MLCNVKDLSFSGSGSFEADKTMYMQESEIQRLKGELKSQNHLIKQGIRAKKLQFSILSKKIAELKAEIGLTPTKTRSMIAHLIKKHNKAIQHELNEFTRRSHVIQMQFEDRLRDMSLISDASLSSGIFSSSMEKIREELDKTAKENEDKYRRQVEAELDRYRRDVEGYRQKILEISHLIEDTKKKLEASRELNEYRKEDHTQVLKDREEKLSKSVEELNKDKINHKLEIARVREEEFNEIQKIRAELRETREKTLKLRDSIEFQSKTPTPELQALNQLIQNLESEREEVLKGQLQEDIQRVEGIISINIDNLYQSLQISQNERNKLNQENILLEKELKRLLKMVYGHKAARKQ